ncbi:hypothetical protein V6N13_147017 [Hibiscus sabdariffa]
MTDIRTFLADSDPDYPLSRPCLLHTGAMQAASSTATGTCTNLRPLWLLCYTPDGLASAPPAPSSLRVDPQKEKSINILIL